MNSARCVVRRPTSTNGGIGIARLCRLEHWSSLSVSGRRPDSTNSIPSRRQPPRTSPTACRRGRRASAWLARARRRARRGLTPRSLILRADFLPSEPMSQRCVKRWLPRSTTARAVEALPAEDAVRRARRTAVVPGLDIPVVALDAYLRAEVTLAESDPHLRPGVVDDRRVGRVESRHGTLGGRSLNADGRPNRPIIGIALDRGPGIRAIADTDSGALDGDVEWDRAVGPMQFIPETWSIRGRDGNDDGVRIPTTCTTPRLPPGVTCAGWGVTSARTTSWRRRTSVTTPPRTMSRS